MDCGESGRNVWGHGVCWEAALVIGVSGEDSMRRKGSEREEQRVNPDAILSEGARMIECYWAAGLEDEDTR